MEDLEPLAWLELEPGERFVRFGVLAHRFARALHPVEDDDLGYGFARVQFDEELAGAVRAGSLKPRNALTFGKHTFPHGAALDNAVVSLEDLQAFAKERDIGVRIRGGASPVAAVETAPDGRDYGGPFPLTTAQIATGFDGLRYSAAQWKKPLGNVPKWLAVCRVVSGVRGVSAASWNPVLIGAHLVRDGHSKLRSVRAKFQTSPLLKPWLEEWKTYEADHFSTD